MPRKEIMKHWPGAFFIAVVLLCGCETTPPRSGFLSNYEQLKPAADREGVMFYVDEAADLGRYTKLKFDPVQVLVTLVPGQPPPPPEVLQRIGAVFEASLRRELAPTYQVVADRGPDVLWVRTAITGIEPASAPAGANGVVPVQASSYVGGASSGGAPRLVELKAEIEVLDPSGQRVAAATATRKGDPRLPQGDRITWDQVQPITDYWARNFRTRLDQLRGVRPPAPQDGGK